MKKWELSCINFQNHFILSKKGEVYWVKVVKEQVVFNVDKSTRNQNTFTVLEFSNFKTFDPKKCLKFFGKGKKL